MRAFAKGMILGLSVMGSGLFATGLAWAKTDLDFALVNETGYVIEEVYLSPTGAADWQENVISGDVLENTQIGRIAFSIGGTQEKCLWDLRVVYSDRATAEWGQVNLCHTNRVVLRYDRNSGKTMADIQ